MQTRNILTPRERRVLSHLLETYRKTLEDPRWDDASVKALTEWVEVLEQVIDSATIPDDKWRTKYLATDAAKWNGEIE
jgi:hypothetical protein